MENNNIITLKNIVVEFDGAKILKGINLNIKDGEFVTLLGPSGCGKTTTLRAIAGFVTPNSGDVFFDGKRINNLPPHKRQVNTIFQRYALFPHLNVYENVAFGLRIKKLAEEEIAKLVKSTLTLVGLKGFEARKVDSLSGGQQQRVAIARALVNRPKVLLLDEPLGALDLKLRKDMQNELKRIQQSLGITFIYVTHDQEEALTMSDTVVVMNDGKILQIGTPEDIYNEPINAFVADFIGESTIVDGLMRKDLLVNFCGTDFVCVDKGFGENVPVEVVIRPEDIKMVAPEKGMFTGTVKSTRFKGVHFEMLVEREDAEFLIHSTKSVEPGSVIGMNIKPFDIHIMNKTSEVAQNEE